jgi:hypothetical protein
MPRLGGTRSFRSHWCAPSVRRADRHEQPEIAALVAEPAPPIAWNAEVHGRRPPELHPEAMHRDDGSPSALAFGDLVAGDSAAPAGRRHEAGEGVGVVAPTPPDPPPALTRDHPRTHAGGWARGWRVDLAGPHAPASRHGQATPGGGGRRRARCRDPRALVAFVADLGPLPRTGPLRPRRARCNRADQGGHLSVELLLDPPVPGARP